MASLPDVPTFAESGFPTIRMDNWFGAIAPAKTPADTTSQLIAWFKMAMTAPEAQQKLEIQGLYSVLNCGRILPIWSAGVTPSLAKPSSKLD